MSEKLCCGGEPITLIVLCGGGSRRMKKDKALLTVDGDTLIERVIGRLGSFFDEVLLSVGQDGGFDFFPWRKVVDGTPDLGPMEGIRSALAVSYTEHNAVVACDMPDVMIDPLREMAGHAPDFDVVVPCCPGGRLGPLFAFYSRTCLPAMTALLGSGERSLLPLFERMRTYYTVLEDCSSLQSLNTPRDYEDYLKRNRG